MTVGEIAMLRLDNPTQILAEMARRGLLAGQLADYWDPERGYVQQMKNRETQASIKHFLFHIEKACQAARADVSEGTVRDGD